MPKILLIDNYDSFTYNLVDTLESIDCSVATIYRDLPFENYKTKIIEEKPDIILISPGYGHPAEAKTVLELIEHYQGIIPILGICLGFQMLVHAFNGRISAMNVPVHGKRSLLITKKHLIFEHLKAPFYVGRYHSLYAQTVPDCFDIIAESQDLVPMAIVNKDMRLLALQFHPESILTEQGEALLNNAINFLLGRSYAC